MDIRNLVNNLRGKLGLPAKDQSLLGMRQEYNKYVLDAQMQGQEPLPFGEYVRQQQMRNSPVPGVGPLSDRDAEMMQPRGPMSDQDLYRRRR